MCIIIYKPENIELRAYVLENASIWHPDGAGFLAWDSESNKLICKKGFFTLDAFLKAFKKYKKHRCIIHFRRATHGDKDKNNCHPYLVNDNLGFVHNGVLGNVKMWDKSHSDSWHFGETILKKITKKHPDIWKDSTFKFLIEGFLGKHNKIALMNNLGEVRIYNEKKGEWNSKCWFSNDSYRYSVSDFDKKLDQTPKSFMQQPLQIPYDADKTYEYQRQYHDNFKGYDWKNGQLTPQFSH